MIEERPLKMDSLDSVFEGGGAIRRINQEPYLFTEGPTKDRDGHIYFVDYKQNLIVRYEIVTGKCETWARNTQGSNGAAFLLEGGLVSCRGGACDVVIWREDGTVERVLASAFNGKPFNGPNDLVISKNGWIYFTDPNFDSRDHQPESVYALSPTGYLTRIDDEIARPNGIILTPNEKTLIINGTAQREIIAHSVLSDGSVTNRRVFASVRNPDREAYPGYPETNWFGCDGMAIDQKGQLFVTCGAGVEVFNPQGHTLGAILIPEKPTNACFGGMNNKTLFVTAQTSVYQVQCRIPGVVFQQDL